MRLRNLACWFLGLLTYIAGGTARCEHKGCAELAMWVDPALDLRTCDLHTGGASGG
jgi:hypothetical protein